LQALKFERRLTTAAQRHSQDMALQDYFSHKQLNGGTPGDRIKAHIPHPQLSHEQQLPRSDR